MSLEGKTATYAIISSIFKILIDFIDDCSTSIPNVRSNIT